MKGQKISLRGRSSRSSTLGSADPRHRRGAQSQTRGEDYAPPLYIDDFGRLAVDTKSAAVNLIYRNVALATDLTAIDDVLLVDTTAGGITISLPPAASLIGRRFYAKNLAANTMTIDPYLAETIDGAATAATAVANTTLTFFSDGAAWYLL